MFSLAMCHATDLQEVRGNQHPATRAYVDSLRGKPVATFKLLMTYYK